MKINFIIAEYYLDQIKIYRYINFIEKISKKRNIEINFILDSTRNYNGEFLDFSVYLNNIKNENSYDAFIFLNDTLFIKHPWKILITKLFDHLPIITTINVPGAIGPVNMSNFLIGKNNDCTDKHISTYLFALNQQAIRYLHDFSVDLAKININDTSWVDTKVNGDLMLNITTHCHLKMGNSIYSWEGLKSNVGNKKIIFSKLIGVIIEYELSKKILNNFGFIIPINVGYRIKIFYYLKKLKSKLNFIYEIK